MRTVKASEVVKGMRVEVTYTYGEVQIVTRGPVVKVEAPNTGGRVWLYLSDDYQEKVHPDHPVTVLAEPEPEWVEGAWYRIGGTVCIRKGRGFYVDAEDDDPLPDVEDVSGLVLGRVLVVDWPGDDVAREIERDYTPGGNWIATENTAAQIIADAIRTQGGAR